MIFEEYELINLLQKSEDKKEQIESDCRIWAI